MTKHWLELFSDGVFAIILTLLVLDLKVPPAHGLAGLNQIAPGLLVHAATFFIVGVLWMTHHGALANVNRINSRALFLKLVALFWATLLPFAARNASSWPYIDTVGDEHRSGCPFRRCLCLLRDAASVCSLNSSGCWPAGNTLG